jgi:hypothetical protein
MPARWVGAHSSANPSISVGLICLTARATTTMSGDPMGMRGLGKWRRGGMVSCGAGNFRKERRGEEVGTSPSSLWTGLGHLKKDPGFVEA